jgi:nitrite reductase (NO-forming)
VKSRTLLLFILLLILISTLVGCGTPTQAASPVVPQPEIEPVAKHSDGGHETGGQTGIADPDYVFTLETATSGGFSYLGEDGVTNPELRVPAGATVGLTVVNGDGIEHDLTIDVLGVHSDHVVAKGESSTVSFEAESPGVYAYYCTLPGHRQAGMEGLLVVEGI